MKRLVDEVSKWITGAALINVRKMKRITHKG
jgi:hypothetical protein